MGWITTGRIVLEKDQEGEDSMEERRLTEHAWRTMTDFSGAASRSAMRPSISRERASLLQYRYFFTSKPTVCKIDS